MWVWLVVLDMVVLEHTPSLPCPHTFSPVHPYIFFNFSLMCLFAYFLMAFGHQVLNANLSSVPTTSINALILTSAVLCTLAYLVFHFRHILRTRGKPESRSWFIPMNSTAASAAKQYQSLARLIAYRYIISLEIIIKALIYRRAACCMHRQQQEEEVTNI